jgi:hypothetical protein
MKYDLGITLKFENGQFMLIFSPPNKILCGLLANHCIAYLSIKFDLNARESLVTLVQIRYALGSSLWCR